MKTPREHLSFQLHPMTLNTLVKHHESRQLNLTPGFQRHSVWSLPQRQKLVESILANNPIPAIFLYERTERGRLVYDVVDGKQRLESVLMFLRSRGFTRDGFRVRAPVDDGARPQPRTWRQLEDAYAQHWWSYQVPTVIVSGEFAEIVKLFVLINSTGKALTSAEKRNARFFDSPLLAEAHRLQKRVGALLQQDRIISPGQAERMKDVELITELLVSVLHGGPINKKTAVDKAVGNEAVPACDLRAAANQVGHTLRIVRKVFPKLRTTRFRNLSEYYSLFMVLWQIGQEKVVFTDRRARVAAERLLIEFSRRVDETREAQVKVKLGKLPKGYEQFKDYLLATQLATDDLAQRKKRAQMLHGLLSGLFSSRDRRRAFSPEQRRLVWHSEAAPKCPRCKRVLTWENFQVDHILAHSRGGFTDIANGKLMCGPCNASKGNRHRSRLPR